MTTAPPTAGPPARAGAAARTPVGTVRQTLRLTRTELTLFHRYRVALFFSVFPLAFAAFGFFMDGDDILPGVDVGAYFITSVPLTAALVLGTMHVPNIYAARREALILKRFRVSGVAPAALFGATTLSVLAVVALITAAVCGIVTLYYGAAPADPLMVALGTVLVTVVLSLLGVALTRLARNAESAQMMSMVPFLALIGASGTAYPVELMPDPLAAACSLLPTAPAVALIRSGYWGRDLFGGLETAGAASGAELWTAALPALAVLAAWTVAAVLLLRLFRWDPRGAA
ncbi:ABC transporter permease [Nocardiopsis trehalosi]|jgi:ABC-2 type transport system permease protein|uniref:ABC transporter permease n=1 Tax=Nocardiopsis trehalosi TaxID=109329 RepID=UPI000831526B|nr:ABC transporter permease [Nocardiopsis trehalosi]